VTQNRSGQFQRPFQIRNKECKGKKGNPYGIQESLNSKGRKIGWYRELKSSM